MMTTLVRPSRKSFDCFQERNGFRYTFQGQQRWHCFPPELHRTSGDAWRLRNQRYTYRIGRRMMNLWTVNALCYIHGWAWDDYGTYVLEFFYAILLGMVNHGTGKICILHRFYLFLFSQSLSLTRASNVISQATD